MATSAQDIVRILQAAGGFIPYVDSNEYYVVLEESNELSERHWFGSQLASETLIASDIRTNSPAVYTVHDDTRSVFCVGEDNALKAFKLLDDEWRGFPLTGIGNILVHPSSRLSGCVDGSDSLVFFEDFKGQLRDLPLKCPKFTDASVANFIAGIHGEIKSKIRDETLKQPRDEPEFFLLALTGETEQQPAELLHIDGAGKRTLLGKIVDAMFRWISDKEATGAAIKSAAGAATTATGKPKPKK